MIVAIGTDRFNSSSSKGNWTMVGDRILAEQYEPRTRFHAYFGRDVSLSNGGNGGICIGCVSGIDIRFGVGDIISIGSMGGILSDMNGGSDHTSFLSCSY